ncbi:sensor histidine kinase [Desulfopila sp. IMCC35008]|uniref:sensor histidine kinase n=1 Tax=Desulfopila sp. IMCC35008 TaxID=2653858 RepID=UPI0013D31CC4|nr:HAMP domain-containing sensor histidine kinase [Desulfopila sp. IMCC35008]
MTIDSSLKTSMFRDGLDEQSQINPLKFACYITILYVVLLSLYIVISGEVTSRLSITVQNLAYFEQYKGIVYALVSGGILFFLSFLTLNRIKQQDDLIIRQNKSILSSEPIVITGIFSASVCHDINNLMTIILGNIEFLEECKRRDDEDLQSIADIHDASTKLISLVKRMMDNGKNYIPGQHKITNMSDVIENTIQFAKKHNKLKNCDITHEIEESLNIDINSILIERMLINIMLNAAEETGFSGKLLIKFYKVDNLATLEVHDNGPGVPDNLHEQIFEPFYTSKRGGNGLGLLSMKICAEQHNGATQLKKSDLGGACFCLTFPIENIGAKAQPSA